MSHGDVAFDLGSRTTIETITRHRCMLPRVTRRHPPNGRVRHCATCGTTYRLEQTVFGLGWWPVSSRDEVVRDRRMRPLSDLTSIGVAP